MGDARKAALKAAQEYAPESDGYMAAHGWEDLSDIRAAFVVGAEWGATQPVSGAAVEAGLGELGAYFGTDDNEPPEYRDVARRIIEAARRADANTTEGEKA